MKTLKILVIALVIVLTGMASWFIYTADYKYTADVTSLQQAIDDTKNLSPQWLRLSVEILEVAETESGLIALVKHRIGEQAFGYVKFARGPNRRYRLESFRIDTRIPYTSFVTVSNPFVGSDENFAPIFDNEVVVIGVNLSSVSEFGIKITRDLDNFVVLEDGEWERVFIGEAILPVESEQFIKILKRDDILALAELTDEDLLRTEELAEYFHRPAVADIYERTRLYDVAGVDITENFALPRIEDGRNRVQSGSFHVWVNTRLIFFIVLVAAILIRLVIKPPVRNRSLKKPQNQDSNLQ